MGLLQVEDGLEGWLHGFAKAANLKVRSSSDAGICPLRHLTAVTKVLMDLLPVAGIYVVLGAWYAWQRCVQRVPSQPRLLRGAVLAVQETYGVILEIVFQLLTCVTIHGTPVLFLSGTVECYTPWQLALLLILLLFLIPLPFYTALAMPLLQRGQLHHGEFLLGMPVPITLHSAHPPQPVGHGPLPACPHSAAVPFGIAAVHTRV